MNRTFQTILAVVVGAVAFVFFVVVLFPLDTAVSHNLAKVEALTGGRFRVVISEMDTSLVFDSEFRGLRVEQKQGQGFVEILNVPRLKVGLSLWALLSRSASLRFVAEFEKGEAGGYLNISEDDLEINLDFNKLALTELGLINMSLKTRDFSLGVRGTLDGTFYMHRPKKMSGMSLEMRFQLRLTDLRLTDIKAKISGQDFYLGELILAPKEGYASFEGEMADGRLTLPQVSFPGNDIEMQLNGRMGFDGRFAVVSSSLNGKFAFSENMIDKVPLLAVISEQRKADGYYPLRISGPFAKPQVRIGNMNLAEMLGW